MTATYEGQSGITEEHVRGGKQADGHRYSSPLSADNNKLVVLVQKRWAAGLPTLGLKGTLKADLDRGMCHFPWDLASFRSCQSNRAPDGRTGTRRISTWKRNLRTTDYGQIKGVIDKTRSNGYQTPCLYGDTRAVNVCHEAFHSPSSNSYFHQLTVYQKFQNYNTS